MDAPPELTKAADAAQKAPEADGEAPYSKSDAAPEPDTFAGVAGAGLGLQPRITPWRRKLSRAWPSSRRSMPRSLRPRHPTRLSFGLDPIYRLVRRAGACPFGGAGGPLPLYVTRLAETGRAVASIRVAVAAIATATAFGRPGARSVRPETGPGRRGDHPQLGLRPRRQAAPAVPEVLRATLAQCGRDEFSGGAGGTRPRHAVARLRRGLAPLGAGGADVGDAEIVPGRGVRLLVRRSKTDQQGRGRRSPSGPIRPSQLFARWFRWKNG